MLLLLLIGCPSAKQTLPPALQEQSPAKPRASVALRVLVVNEPALAEAINRLRGEWAERAGGELSATSMAWADVTTAKTLDADAIVFPSRYLGELCVRDWLRPVRPSVLDSDDFNSADVFPLVRNELMKWGGQVMALPLAVDPTATRPADARHSAISFLAEAAAGAMADNREGVLFDSETMKPRITEPAFADALKRLAQSDIKTVPQSSDARPIPVLGFADRLVAVSSTSHNAASAFKLVTWLVSAETSSQLASAGERALPVRRSQASSPVWYESSATSSERADRGKALEAALGGRQCLLIPRIPGIDKYMAALDNAVKAAAVDHVPPEKALQAAAEKWEQITNAHGRDSQRQAFLKHLGISDK